MEPETGNTKLSLSPRAVIATLVVILIGFAGYISYLFLSGTAVVLPQGLHIEQAEFTEGPNDRTDDVVGAYKNSEFKVVKILQNPYRDTTHYDALYVVGKRGVNDNGCGSSYGSDTCYFFLESNYYGVPPITHIGSWSNGIVGFKDANFKDQNIVKFSATGGDAGAFTEQEWELDLRTGSTTRISNVLHEVEF